MAVARVRGNAEAVPASDAVHPDLSAGNVLFEQLKRSAQSHVKLLAGNDRELGLRIVDVVEVEAGKSHVPQRLVQLVLQIGGRHAMAAAGDVGETRDAAQHAC